MSSVMKEAHIECLGSSEDGGWLPDWEAEDHFLEEMLCELGLECMGGG